MSLMTKESGTDEPVHYDSLEAHADHGTAASQGLAMSAADGVAPVGAIVHAYISDLGRPKSGGIRVFS